MTTNGALHDGLLQASRSGMYYCLNVIIADINHFSSKGSIYSTTMSDPFTRFKTSFFFSSFFSFPISNFPPVAILISTLTTHPYFQSVFSSPVLRPASIFANSFPHHVQVALSPLFQSPTFNSPLIIGFHDARHRPRVRRE